MTRARSHTERGQLFGMAPDGSTWVDQELPFEPCSALLAVSAPVVEPEAPLVAPAVDNGPALFEVLP